MFGLLEINEEADGVRLAIGLPQRHDKSFSPALNITQSKALLVSGGNVNGTCDVIEGAER